MSGTPEPPGTPIHASADCPFCQCSTSHLRARRGMQQQPDAAGWHAASGCLAEVPVLPAAAPKTSHHTARHRTSSSSLKQQVCMWTPAQQSCSAAAAPVMGCQQGAVMALLVSLRMQRMQQLSRRATQQQLPSQRCQQSCLVTACRHRTAAGLTPAKSLLLPRIWCQTACQATAGLTPAQSLCLLGPWCQTACPSALTACCWTPLITGELLQLTLGAGTLV